MDEEDKKRDEKEKSEEESELEKEMESEEQESERSDEEEQNSEKNETEEQSNIDDFSIRNLSDFMNASEEIKAPVLEKIANAVNPTQLERQIWNFSQTGNSEENKDEERIRYGTQSGYAANTESQEGSRGIQYNPEPNPGYSNIIRDKGMEESRRFVERNLPGSEWSNQRSISDIEKPMDIESEEIRETKRYMHKGDYKA